MVRKSDHLLRAHLIVTLSKLLGSNPLNPHGHILLFVTNSVFTITLIASVTSIIITNYSIRGGANCHGTLRGDCAMSSGRSKIPRFLRKVAVRKESRGLGFWVFGFGA